MSTSEIVIRVAGEGGENTVVTGVLAGLFGLPPLSLESLIRSRLGSHAEFIDENLRALETGLHFATKELTKVRS